LKKKIKIYTIGISVIFHLIIFLLTDSAIKLNIFAFRQMNSEIEKTDPIVFDLNRENPVKELIESPDLKREKENKNPKYLSDKNISARDNSLKKVPLKDDPFSKGEIDAPVIPEDSRKKIEKPKKKEKISPGETSLNSDKISREKEEKTEPEQPKDGNRELNGLYNIRTDNELLRKNIESQVQQKGGFSFSTYNWDFAPYMLEMKRKIHGNIFPPLAFKQLGLIDGETLLRFTISRDGTLSNLQVIGYKGHKSLMDTSVQAIRISAPFKALPEDFPDENLIVTGKFIYFVRR